MRLVSLRAANYRMLRRVAVDFPDGVIGLLGRNGTGKTSLLEAITVALYGTAVSRTSKADLIGRDRRDMTVELTFELAGTTYRVERRLAQRNLAVSAKLFRGGEQIAEGSETVTGQLTELLGGYRELSISRFVGQRQLNALSLVDAPERKRLILRLLGVEAAERAQSSLREQLRDHDRTLKARTSALPDASGLNDEIAALEHKLVELTARRAELEQVLADARAAAERAATELAGIEQRGEGVGALRTTLELLEERLAELATEEAELHGRSGQAAAAAERLAEIDAQLASAAEHRAEYAALEAARALRDGAAEIGEQISALERELATLEREERRLRALAAGEAALAARQEQLVVELHELAAATAAAEAVRLDARATVGRLRAERARLERQLDDLAGQPSAQACPTCGQAIDDPAAFREHLEQRRAELDGEEQATIAAGIAAKQRVDDAAAARARLELEQASIADRLVEARASAAELRIVSASVAAQRDRLADARGQQAEALAVPYDEARHLALAAEVESMPALSSLQSELRAEVGAAARLEQDIARLAERRAELEQRQAQAHAAAAAAGYDPAAHEAARTALEEARAFLAAADRALIEHGGEERLAAVQLDGARRRATERRRLLDELDEMRSVRGTLELARETMDRFRTALIGRVRPAIERKASRLLAELTEGRYTRFVLSDDYELSIGGAGEVRPYEGISGGEQDIANLALRLAISELINEAQGISMTFLVLDEVLGSQDPERQENIMAVLPRLAAHFGQVIMVSHFPAVQDRFSSIIRVEFDPASETSTIEYPPAHALPAAA